MTSLLLHGGAGVADAAGSWLYRVSPDHLAGVAALVALPLAAILVRAADRLGSRRAYRLRDGYRSLGLEGRMLVWLLLASAAVHGGLVASGLHGGLAAAFALQAAALVHVVHRQLRGRRFRLRAAVVLAGGLVAYAVAGVAGEPPDQVGVATKLVELTALALVLAPVGRSRARGALATGATLAAFLATGLAAWVGSFAAAELQGPGAAHAAAPAPGTVLAAVDEREPTAAERAAVARFSRTALAALARYGDLSVAARAGYDVDGIGGPEFHAGNSRFQSDERIFDPMRPESLVYAATSRGPLLLGAQFEMPGLGERGPAIGGPLTHWHGHEQVCVSLTPPALSGLVSPFGGCAALSITIPVTPEAIHFWAVPGLPNRFGEISDEDRRAYIEAYEAGRPLAGRADRRPAALP